MYVVQPMAVMGKKMRCRAETSHRSSSSKAPVNLGKDADIAAVQGYDGGA